MAVGMIGEYVIRSLPVVTVVCTLDNCVHIRFGEVRSLAYNHEFIVSV